MTDGDPDEEIDEEMEEFIQKFVKDIKRIDSVTGKLESRPNLREKVNIFYNAYNAYRLNKFTKLLAFATVVLAGASILQTMTFLLGEEETLGLVEQVTGGLIAAFAILVIFAIFIGFLSSIKRTMLCQKRSILPSPMK